MIPAPLIALGLWFLSQNMAKKKEDAKSLSLVPVGIQAKNLNNIVLEMQVINPSSSQFKIDSLNANLYNAGKIIGTINRPEPFTIKPSGNSIVQFAVKPNVGNVAANLINVLFTKAKLEEVKVLGAYKYYGLSFAIDKTLKL